MTKITRINDHSRNCTATSSKLLSSHRAKITRTNTVIMTKIRRPSSIMLCNLNVNNFLQNETV